MIILFWKLLISEIQSLDELDLEEKDFITMEEFIEFGMSNKAKTTEMRFMITTKFHPQANTSSACLVQQQAYIRLYCQSQVLLQSE